MARVRVGRRDAAAVGHLLHELGQGKGLSGDLQHDANRMVSAIHGTMERGEVQQVAGLLRQASAEQELLMTYRDAARYWAAYLEGCLWLRTE